MTLQKAEKIGEILQRTLASLGIAERIKEAQLVGKFKEIVGEQVAEQAEAISIKKGSLLVRVKSPAWRHELTFLKQEIIEKLNQALGEKLITDIYFSG